MLGGICTHVCAGACRVQKALGDEDLESYSTINHLMWVLGIEGTMGTPDHWAFSPAPCIPHCWEQVSHWTWSLPIWLDLLASEPRNLPVSISIILGFQVLLADLKGWWGSELSQVLIHAQQTFHSLSHLPSPEGSFSKDMFYVFLM